MRDRRVDYLTVAGLAIFVIMSSIYLCRDRIGQMLSDLSLDSSSTDVTLPFGIPVIDLEWFYEMDTASQIMLCFLATCIVATLIGGTCMYLIRRRLGSRK